MYLRTQDESAIYDFDKYGYIASDKDGTVLMGGASETAFILGKYANQTRANEVIGDIYVTGLEMDRYDMPVV